MFGLPEALMSFIRRQVGLRTDAADASGSVHAKLTHIDEYLLALVPGTPFHLKTPTLTRVSTDISGTFLTITGPRIILGGVAIFGGRRDSTYTYRTGISIVIDDNTVVTTGSDSNYTEHNYGAYYTMKDGGDDVFRYEKAYPICGPFRINSQLRLTGSFERDRGSFAAAIWHVPV